MSSGLWHFGMSCCRWQPAIQGCSGTAGAVLRPVSAQSGHQAATQAQSPAAFTPNPQPFTLNPQP